jgi:hypothetical protein
MELETTDEELEGADHALELLAVGSAEDEVDSTAASTARACELKEQKQSVMDSRSGAKRNQRTSLELT